MVAGTLAVTTELVEVLTVVLVVAVPFAKVPEDPVDGAAKVTVWLDTGLPNLSRTWTISALVKAKPVLADCGEPE